MPKVYYRKQLLRFSIDLYDRGEIPTNHITVYHAVKWLCQAWIHDVDNSTIMACFQKSTAIASNLPTTTLQQPDLLQLYQTATSSSGVRDIMDLQNFLNPPDENEAVQEDFSLEDIIQQHLQVDNAEEELEDEDPPQPRISNKEALEAVIKLISFQEQQEDTQYRDLQTLNLLQRLIHAKMTSRQSTLEQWLR